MISISLSIQRPSHMKLRHWALAWGYEKYFDFGEAYARVLGIEITLGWDL